MRGFRKFCQRGPNSDKFVFCLFCFFEGSDAPKTTISGQLSAYQRNAIEMAFRWRDDNGLHRMLAL